MKKLHYVFVVHFIISSFMDNTWSYQAFLIDDDTGQFVDSLCLIQNSSSLLGITSNPGSYDPESLELEDCTKACEELEIIFVIFTMGSICHCQEYYFSSSVVSSALCQEPCTGNSLQVCGGGLGLYTIRESVPFNAANNVPLYKLALSSPVTRVNTLENVEILSKQAITYSDLYYVLSNENIPTAVTGSIIPIYFQVPGIYKVQVCPNGIKSYENNEDCNEVSIDVRDVDGAAEFNASCPSFKNLFEIGKCEVEIIEAKNCLMSHDTGTSISMLNIPIPDTLKYVYGTSLQAIIEEMEPEDSNSVILDEYPIENDGILEYFVLILTNYTELTLQLNSGECEMNVGYCKLITKSGDARYSIDLTVSDEGYTFIQPSKILNVKRGDYFQLTKKNIDGKFFWYRYTETISGKIKYPLIQISVKKSYKLYYKVFSDVPAIIENKFVQKCLTIVKNNEQRTVFQDYLNFTIITNDGCEKETDTIFINTIFHSGSFFTITYDFDTTAIFPVIQNISKINPNVTYSLDQRFTEGHYNITAYAENSIGTFVNYAPLCIQYPELGLWIITSLSSTSAPPGNLNLDLNHNGRIPTNETLVIDFQDGSPLEIFQVTPSSGTQSLQFSFKHVYNSKGIYNLNITAYNEVSSYEYTHTVEYLVALESLSVKMKFFDNGFESDGYGPEKNVFKTTEIIFVFASIVPPDAPFNDLVIQYSDGIPLLTASYANFSLPMLQEGLHNLKIHAELDGDKIGDVSNFIVVISDKIQIKDAFSNGMLDIDGMYMEFLVEFDEIGFDACAYIECVSSSDEFITARSAYYGLYCPEISVGDQMYEIKPSTRIDVRFEFEDFYECKAYGSNIRSSAQFYIGLVTVAKLDCTKIEATLFDSVQETDPEIVFGNEELMLYANAQIDCKIQKTFSTTKVWTATSVDSDDENFGSQEIGSESMKLKITPNTLPYGLVKISFTYTLLGQKLPVYKTIRTFFQVKLSPIDVRMTADFTREITKGEVEILDLTPFSSSINPNLMEGETEEREITYMCKKVGETFPIEPEDLENPPTEFNEKHKPELSNSGLGGCFGNGPGFVDVDGAKDYTMFMSTFIDVPGKYELYAVVHSKFGGHESSGVGFVALNVNNGVAPKMGLKCISGMKCKLHNLCYNVLNDSTINLELKFEAEKNTEPTLEIEIYSMTNNIETLIVNGDDYIEEILKEITEETGVFVFSIIPTLYSENVGVENFIIKASVSPDGTDYSFTSTCIHPKFPPIAGTCDLNININSTMSQEMAVNCSNFIDPNKEKITEYTFFGKIVGTGEILFFEVTGFPNTITLLPINKVIDVYVTAKNYAGGTVTVKVGQDIKCPNSTDIIDNADKLDEMLFRSELEGKSAVTAHVLGLKAEILRQKLDTILSEKFVDDLPAKEIEANELLREILQKYPKDLGPSVGLSKMQDLMSVVKDIDSKMNLENKESFVQILTSMGGDFPKQQENEESFENLFELKIASYIDGMNILQKLDASNPFMSKDSPKDMDIFNNDAQNNINGYGEKSNVMKSFDKSKNDNLMNLMSKSIEDTIRESFKQRSSGTSTSGRINKTNYEYEYTFGNSSEWSRETYSSAVNIVCQMLNRTNCTQIPYNVGSVVFKLKCMSLFKHRQQLINDQNNSTKLDEDDVNGIHKSTTVFVGTKENVFKTNKMDNEYVYNNIENCLDQHNMELVNASLLERDFGVYHKISFIKNTTSCLTLIFEQQPSGAVIFEKFSSKASYNNFDYYEEIVTNKYSDSGWTYERCYGFSSENYVSVVIAQLNLNSTTKIYGNETFTFKDFSKNITSYKVQAYQLNCKYWDEDSEQWMSYGHEGFRIYNGKKQCKWNHLTTFGSGFVVKPNTIDFDYVFENADIDDNLTIYLTVIISLVIYIFILIWARINDRKDLARVGSTPLSDNDPKDKYVYEVLVFTGNKSQAGTDSKVQFILSGENGSTKIRTLGDPKRKILQRADVNSFIMTESRPLGRLQFLRVWHDNSGDGSKKSWYLELIVIRDVHANVKYQFLTHQWLAVEKDDGKTDRLIPVSGLDERLKFKHLFSTTSNQKLRDDHLWLSIFLRPVRSRFTRVQRASACMAMLYLSMLVNIMWYGRADDKPAKGLKVGPFHFSPEQIGIGIISNFIVFVPSILIIFFFRKSRPRRLRPSKINEVLGGKEINSTLEDDKNTDENDSENDENISQASTIPSEWERPEKIDNKKSYLNSRRKKKTFTLPWWCIYIAWLLTIVCIGTSLFFLWAYGISFGNDKTTNWFTSLIVSFIFSIFFTQPLKVLLLSLVLSLIYKKDDYDEHDCDVDEEDPRLKFDETWLHSNAEIKRSRSVFKGMDKDKIMMNKIQRQKEVEMSGILREVFAYIIFLWIILIISYGNRDPNSTLMYETILNGFLKPGDFYLDFRKAKTTEKFYFWLNKAFIPELMVTNWYNKRPPNGLGGYVDDRSNFLVGMPIMRQVRIKKNICAIDSTVYNLTDNCAGFGTIINEETQDFRVGWNLSMAAPKSYEYFYQPARKLQSMPFWGEIDWYGGGGYVYPFTHPLKGQHRHYLREMHKLQERAWIDKYTRAVFIEFNLYNSQVNLFSYVTFVVEMMPGGGMVPFFRIEIMKLLRYHTDFGLFVLICELVFMIFIIYFTVRELKELIKKRRAYIKDPGNVLEMLIVIFGYVGFVMFIQREFSTRDALKVFKDSNGKGYIRLQYAMTIDETLGYILAILVFLANLKFLHLLRFNKRFSILSHTLMGCASELTGFGLCLLILLLAFVQLFYLVLGLYMQEFSTFLSSVEASFSMMLGKFKFHQIKLVAPIMGPVIFFIFALSTTIILLNILLTIVIKTFYEVKEKMINMPNEYEIIDFIKKTVSNTVGMNRKRKVEPANDSSQSSVTKKAKDHSQVNQLSEKVDKLLNYVNSVYLVNEKKSSKKILLKPDIDEDVPMPFNNNSYRDI